MWLMLVVVGAAVAKAPLLSEQGRVRTCAGVVGAVNEPYVSVRGDLAVNLTHRFALRGDATLPIGLGPVADFGLHAQLDLGDYALRAYLSPGVVARWAPAAAGDAPAGLAVRGEVGLRPLIRWGWGLHAGILGTVPLDRRGPEAGVAGVLGTWLEW
jgi:hypothetical protein